jgi:acyl-CoA oxidase
VRKTEIQNEFIHDFDFDTLHYQEQRKVVLQLAQIIADNLPFDLFHGLRHDYSAYVTLIEQLGVLNPNVVIKLAVQYSLFGGCVVNLGTDRHHKLVKDLSSLKLLGCFGMTEKGHGSNVRGIETTATYDKNTKEFVINTPHVKAMKTWIGGSGYAHMSAVFANLIIDGKSKGVHVFLVPMRDQKGNILPGVIVEDCEYKMGLNGIDNMSFGFKNVRIPRTNLLNRFSDVTEDGRYVCEYPEPKHFGMTVGELSGGRLSLSGHGITMCKTALTIAIRYGFKRKQFGPPGKEEVPIMTYPTHYRRLMPLLARTVAYVPFLNYGMDVFAQREKDPNSLPLAHSLSSVIKAGSSWHMLNLLSVCRQCCGGAGFRAPNKISGLIRDSHVFATFEGDNTVLTQQTAKYLLALYAQGSKIGKFTGILSYASARQNALALTSSVEDKLLCLKNQQHLFEEREFAMLQELAANLERRRRSGQNEWEAFTAELVLAKDLALAHSDRIIHELFVESSQICSFANSGVLTLLAKLNGLTLIQENLGWFVSHEVLAASAARKVEPLIVDLSKEVSRYALDIVDAFQIPDKYLPPADLSDYTVGNTDYKFSK